MSSKPSLLPISQLALINPPLTRAVKPNDEVSFIPMVDVSESGRLIGAQTRRQSEVAAGYTPFEEGDVLFAKITPCMENGKGCHAIGLNNGVGYGSTEFHVLRAKQGINSRFLYYWTVMDTLRKKAESFMIGSAGQQRVQTSFFDYFLIPKLKEEDQIFAAHVLDIIDEAIQKTEQLIAKLKAIKQGLLHDLLTRGLDENGQLRDPIAHPEQFKDSPLGRIPKEWEVYPLNNIGKIVSGTTPSRTVPKYWDGTIPWITPTDMSKVNNDHISSGQDYITESGLASCSATLLPIGSIVVTTRATLGLTAVTELELATNQGFKNLIPNAGWNTSFLCYKIRALSNEMIKRASGTTFLEISGKQFALMEIAAPEPESEEQDLIANAISVHNQSIEKEEYYLSKIKLLKKGLMHDLLTGKVRVNIQSEEQENEDRHDS